MRSEGTNKWGFVEKFRIAKMSNLVKHAQKELKLVVFFDECSDYDGELRKAVMELVRLPLDVINTKVE